MLDLNPIAPNMNPVKTSIVTFLGDRKSQPVPTFTLPPEILGFGRGQIQLAVGFPTGFPLEQP